MAKNFYTGIDLNLNQLENVVFEQLATDPGSPVEGQFWFNTTDHLFKHYDGTSTVVIPTTAITRASAASAAGELVVSAGADRSAKTYDGSAGMVKASASGVASAAVDGTDYVSPDGAATLTNKTIDANGTGNAISNIEVEDLAASAKAADIATGTSSQVATADVIKTYVDTQITALGQFVGDHDASGGALPTTGSGASGAIVKGDYWRISVAGTISGLGELEVGDVLVAKADDADEASDFFVMQGNITDAVTSSAASTTDNRIARADGTTGKVVQFSLAEIDDSGSVNIPSGQSYKINGVDVLANVIGKYNADFNNTTDWTGASAPFTFTVAQATHALATDDTLLVQVKDSSGNVVEVDIETQSDGDVVISSNEKFAGKIMIVG